MNACHAIKNNPNKDITAVNVNATAGNTDTSFGAKMVVSYGMFRKDTNSRNAFLRHNVKWEHSKPMHHGHR